MTEQIKQPRTLTAEDFEREAKVSRSEGKAQWEWHPTDADYRSIPLFHKRVIDLTVESMPDRTWAGDIKVYAGRDIHHAERSFFASPVEAFEFAVHNALNVVNVLWKREYEDFVKEERRKEKANQDLDAFLKSRLP